MLEGAIGAGFDRVVAGGLRARTTPKGPRVVPQLLTQASAEGAGFHTLTFNVHVGLLPLVQQELEVKRDTIKAEGKTIGERYWHGRENFSENLKHGLVRLVLWNKATPDVDLGLEFYISSNRSRLAQERCHLGQRRAQGCPSCGRPPISTVLHGRRMAGADHAHGMD